MQALPGSLDPGLEPVPFPALRFDQHNPGSLDEEYPQVAVATFRYLAEVGAEEAIALARGDASLGEKGADLIDDARALADKALTHAVQRLQMELLGGLGGNELPRRPLDPRGDRLRIPEVVLLGLRVGANI